MSAKRVTENGAGALTSGTPEDPEGFVRCNKRTFIIRLAAGVAATIAVALVLLLIGQGELLWQFFPTLIGV